MLSGLLQCRGRRMKPPVQPAHNASYVTVDGGDGLSEGDGGNSGSRVRADPWEFPEFIVGGGQGSRDHLSREAMKPSGAGIVACPRPRCHDRLFIG